MRIAKIVYLLLALSFVVTPLTAETLLKDNFDDDSLDQILWFTDTSSPNASINETGQRIELGNRGFLNTQKA